MGWWILVLSSLDAVLSTIDRQTVAVLQSTIKDQFAIGDSEYGMLVTAFLGAYSIFFVVCGWLTDRFGSRVMLTVFIAVWSVASVLSGTARSFPELAIYRALLGAAEAGLTPATIYALVRWFPKERLATAYGLRGPIIALGPILAPPIIVGLALAFGWRAAFWVPGSIGFVFAAAWWLSDRNPVGAQTTSVSLTLRTVLQSKALWALIGARFISDPLWFFVQHWQAGYLQDVVGLSLAQVGGLLWIPPLAAALLAVAVTMWSDHRLRQGQTVRRSRVAVMQAAAILAPLVMIIPFVKDVPLVLALLTATHAMCLCWLFLSNVLLAAFFEKGMVGTAAGVLNALGAAGAAALSPLIGEVVERFGYTPIFLFGACLHPLATLLLHVSYRRDGHSLKSSAAADTSVDAGGPRGDDGLRADLGAPKSVLGDE